MVILNRKEEDKMEFATEIPNKRKRSTYTPSETHIIWECLGKELIRTNLPLKKIISKS